MFKKMGYYFMAATVALALQPAMAMENSTISTKAPETTFASQGIRVSLVKPFLDGKVRINSRNNTYHGDIDVDNTIGLAVGYAYLPVRKIGFTTNLAYITVDNSDNSTDNGFVRFDGNAAYAVTSIFHIYGGLNPESEFSPA